MICVNYAILFYYQSQTMDMDRGLAWSRDG